ncbi:unnamed protein product, partial [Prorocentrum cordatum]
MQSAGQTTTEIAANAFYAWAVRSQVFCYYTRSLPLRALSLAILPFHAQPEEGQVRPHPHRDHRSMADPAPVAQTFFVDEDVKAAYESWTRSSPSWTLSTSSLPRISEQRPEGVENEALEQVAFADRILLNKVDLVDDAEKEQVKECLRRINKYADIIETQQSAIDVKAILGIKRFDLARVLDRVRRRVPERRRRAPARRHDFRVGIQFDGALDLPRLNAWLSRLLEKQGVDIFRSKGVLNIEGTEARYVFQGVHMLMGFSSSADSDVRPWSARGAANEQAGVHRPQSGSGAAGEQLQGLRGLLSRRRTRGSRPPPPRVRVFGGGWALRSRAAAAEGGAKTLQAATSPP